MAHNIYGKRFYSYRKPAWWDIEGLCVFEQQLSATDALAAVGADVQYSAAPLYAVVDGQTVEIPGQRAILRHPTEDDPHFAPLGVVSDKYVLIHPRMVTEEFDRRVGVGVETLGFLRGGATLFLSVELPDFTVGQSDDRVRSYMIVESPMTGDEALEVRVAPVRVVCENTLRASDRWATERYSIPHVADAVETMGHYFSRIYDVALSKSRALQQAYESMASCRLGRDAALELSRKLYPVPARPDDPDGIVPEDKLVAAMKRWEAHARSQERAVNALVELWDGRVAGHDLPSMRGTVWRWYNCATELENYRWFSTPAGRGSSVMDGARGRRMASAFELAIEHLESVGAFSAGEMLTHD